MEEQRRALRSYKEAVLAIRTGTKDRGYMHYFIQCLLRPSLNATTRTSFPSEQRPSKIEGGGLGAWELDLVSESQARQYGQLESATIKLNRSRLLVTLVILFAMTILGHER